MVRRSLAGDSSPANVAAQAKKAIDRYEIELINHFEMEERILFPACPPSELIDSLIADHREIEGLVKELRKAPTAELLERFCALLSTHIRREESEYFECVQRELPRDVLDRIGAEIDRRAVRVCL